MTVVGQRVNVNAVTAHTNQVAQDYALVVSAGDGTVKDALTLGAPADVSANTPNVTVVTNDFASVPDISGQLLLSQHVGASTPLLGTNLIGLGANSGWGTSGAITVGITNQWHFYVLTNPTNFTNAAFATFLSPDLSLPRMGVTNVDDPDNATRVEADIDLYVSTDSSLTNLNPDALANADQSLTRGGTEFVVKSNAMQGQTWYAAVKSEDQQAAEYAFFGVFSELPFSQSDSNGVLMRGMQRAGAHTRRQPLESGRGAGGVHRGAAHHSAARGGDQHDHARGLWDLQGNLSHNQKFAVLNNHTFGNSALTQQLIYEDNNEHDLGPLARPSDGPGNLRNFVGEKGAGVWLLAEVDSASTHTGQVDSLWIRLEPQSQTNDVLDTVLTIQPNSFAYNAIDVPLEATNMTILVENQSSPALPLQLYVKRGDFPTQGDYDYTQTIDPGNLLSWTPR